MMRKIICYIFGAFFVGIFILGNSDLSAALKSVQHISDRIKIQRPGAAPVQEPAIKPSEKEAPPAGAPAAQAGKGEAPVESPASPSGMASLSLEEQNELFLGTQGRFYTREGRVDPFEPFLRVPDAQVSNVEQEKLKIRPPQTPLERYDLSQLKLTGVIQAPGKVRALVQETSGKGYIVSEGTYIGNKGGQVTKILNDRIVVEEKYLDILGNVASKDIEVKLRPSDE